MNRKQDPTQPEPRVFRGLRGVEGVETRTIGREAELQQLRDAFHAAQGGQCRVVTVAGEAGVGKSRLLYEFEGWLIPETPRYFRGRANPVIQHQPYALMRDVFAFCFQIQDSDPAEVVRAKLESGVGEVLEGPDAARTQAHVLGQWLGFDLGDSPYSQIADRSTSQDDAQHFRDRALKYLRDFFQATTDQAPAVILLEDVHWADDSSLDVIQRLARALADRRLLVVCLAWPTLFERRPHWDTGWLGHTRLELQPLSGPDSGRLVDEILKKAVEVPSTLRDLVVDGAKGNPFYVEELIKMLVEDGVIVKGEPHWRVDPQRLPQVRVPSTLTGVLQARLDSLPTAERSVLQRASVMGQLFWDSALTHVGGDDAQQKVTEALSALGNKEMIFQRRSSALEGAQEYVFKHVVLREVAYESVLKQVRRTYHELVAEWLMEHGGERVDEYTGLIADHLDLAEQTERARVYLRRAGEQAAARFANAEAVSYFSRALDLTPRTDATCAERYDLLSAREKIYDLLGTRETQAQDLATLAELARTLNDHQKQAQVALRHANYAALTGDYATALAAAQTAIRLAQMARDESTTAAGYLQWGWVLWHLGDLEAAKAQIEQALTLAQIASLRQVEAASRRSLGNIAWSRGDYAEAQIRYEQTLRICREVGDQWGESAALNNLGNVASSQGDYARATNYFEHTLRICHTIGNRWIESATLHNLGMIAHRQGDYARAGARIEEALRISLEVGDRLGEGDRLAYLGLIAHCLGDDETARDRCQRALAIAQDLGNRHLQAGALTYLGYIQAGLGLWDQAANTYRRALHLRRELGEHHLTVEPLAGLAHISLTLGDLTQAQTQVEEILSHLQTGNLSGTDEPFRVYLTCYRVLQANQDARAQDVLHTAHTLLQERAAQIDDATMRRLFLESVAAHREIVRDFNLADRANRSFA